jgi:hypothetical protein
VIHASGQCVSLWRQPESMEAQQDPEFNQRVDDMLSTLIVVMDDVHDPRGRQGVEWRKEFGHVTHEVTRPSCG